eukprot:m51a1_g2589 hypothetical protein (1913) ;mRNA; r:418345-424701
MADAASSPRPANPAASDSPVPARPPTTTGRPDVRSPQTVPRNPATPTGARIGIGCMRTSSAGVEIAAPSPDDYDTPPMPYIEITLPSHSARRAAHRSRRRGDGRPPARLDSGSGGSSPPPGSPKVDVVPSPRSLVAAAEALGNHDREYSRNTLKRRPKARPTVMAQLERHIPAGTGERDLRANRVLAWGDYEERMKKESATLPPALQYPEGSDNVAVQYIRRSQRSCPRSSKITTGGELPEAMAYVGLITDEYSRDWCVVDWKQAAFGLQRNTFAGVTAPSSSQATPARPDTGDIFAPRRTPSVKPGEQSSSASGGAASTKESSGSSLSIPFHTPHASQKDLMGLTTSGQHGAPLAQSMKPFSHSRVLLSATVKGLKVFLGESEPLFCTLSLYDCDSRTKMSEDFHFSINTTSLFTGLSLADVISPTAQFFRSMSFAISGPSSGLWLVLKANRILHADLDKDAGPLSRSKSSSSSSKELQRELREIVTHWAAAGISPALQPALWVPMQLYAPGISELQQIHRAESLIPIKGVLTDDIVFDYAATEPDRRAQKYRGLPGVLEIEVNIPALQGETYVDAYMRLDPSLQVVRSSTERRADMKILKELQDFTVPTQPYSEVVNNLYVYPETVVIKNATNLQVGVQLLEASTLVDGRAPSGLRCVFPALYYLNSIDEPEPKIELETEARTTVQWGERRPLFSDELKLLLPLNIVDHLLLFTFYNVNPSSKTPRTVLGYAGFRISHTEDAASATTSKTCHISDFNYGQPITLPICRSLSEVLNTAPVSGADAKKLKHSFVFHAKLYSSVFPQDTRIVKLLNEVANLKRLLSVTHARTGSSVPLVLSSYGTHMPILQAISQISSTAVVHFFYPLMHALLRALCLWSDANSKEAFKQVWVILQKVVRTPIFVGTECDNAMFRSYVYQVFDPTPIQQGAAKPLQDLLISYWLEALSVPGSIDILPSLNWFMLDLISKSAIVTAWFNKTLEADIPHESRCTSTFQHCVPLLINELLRGYSKSFKAPPKEGLPMPVNVRATVVFANAMFTLVDRGLLINTIKVFMDDTDPSNDDPVLANSIKTVVLRTLADFEHFVPLNLPTAFDNFQLDSVTALQSIFWQRHPLVGLVLNEVHSCFKQPRNALIRQLGIKTLRELLRKHYCDSRYQDADSRSRIASMYFPFIISLIPDVALVNQLAQQDVGLHHDLLCCVVFILRYTPMNLLKCWWVRDTQKRHFAFFELLLLCASYFHDQPQRRESCEAICNICDEFVVDRKEYLNSAKDPVLEEILSVLLEDLGGSPTDAMGVAAIARTLSSLRLLVDTLPAQFFEISGNSFVDQLTYELLSFANAGGSSEAPALIDQMASLFVHMLRESFKMSKDMPKMKIQTTLATSKLVGEEGFNYAPLMGFLETVNMRITEHKKQDFKKAALDIVGRMSSLVTYQVKISKTKDPETLADLIYETAEGYVESPDMRLTWLDNLSVKHSLVEYNEEAAQCKIMAALLVSQYLEVQCHLPLQSKAEFAKLVPNLGTKLTDLDIREAVENRQFQSGYWNLETLVKLLRDAVSLLMKSHLPELCIEIFGLLETIYKREKNYSAMIEVLNECATVCASLVMRERDRDKSILGKFYRVAFFGKCVEELDGKEYVYKMPAKYDLARMQEYLVGLLASRVGGRKEAVQMLPNRTVDLASLQEGVAYFQMAHVTPHFEQSDTSRTTPYERHYNISMFIWSQAFSEGKKQQTESLKEQKKKKSILTTELAFPFVKNRLRVISRKETILEPIETALELILDRCEKLVEQLESNPPKLNPLQQVLQGSVAAMVNEGPLKICELFLGEEERKTQQEKHVEKLSRAMANLMELCCYALELDNSLIGPKHKPFHDMLEKNFTELATNVVPFLLPAHTGFRTSCTKEDIEKKAWRELPRVSSD